MFLLAKTLEAVLFASHEPVSAETLAALHASVTGDDVPSAAAIAAEVEALNADYAEGGRCFRIYAWGGGYRLATTEDVAPILKAYFRREETRRLSRPQMETLAVIAYRQPVTKPEIDHVRGVASDHALRKLIELGFVAMVGRSDSVGRPLLYGTTSAFLDQFGLSSLDDLPKPREIEELLNDPAFNRERAALLANLDAEAADEAPLHTLLTGLHAEAVAPDAPETERRGPLDEAPQDANAAHRNGHP